MNKKSIIAIASVIVLAFTGCTFNIQPPASESTKVGLTEAEAKIIAEKNCIKEGESLSPGYYNDNSQTWWFDANLKSTNKGCNPACVVSENTKTAEINWRCTGLLLPEESTSNVLQKLFAEKYPQYAEDVSVIIEQEAANHARGSVNFKIGEPGGIFLAVKTDGEWQIVHDGNGIIPCDLNKYGFPAKMLSDCAK
ncbi:hypothetical protein KJ835_02995 [Patescibacteria group bacterium]|nr:hypothetical protein [Patescibacteria group bacterium]MBU1953578.1 hypothetical protein [Patescibacteria group bacterium]